MAQPTPIAISVEKVNKTFKLPHEKNTSIKGAVVNFYRQNRSFEKQHVLNDITFSIKQGEFFGIIGRNGSGKSTLLKLLAGIYSPDSGSLQVNGKLTPFIELGVGFNAELTGRENVFLNGALLGFSRKEMLTMYDDIVTFAELESFMDQKLKNYSSGMQVRLAFSIAIRAESDILLIDEVLAVGDAAFQTKCLEYFQKLKEDKRTVVFVSHDRGSLEKFCDAAVLIDKGNIIARGSARSVLQSYDKIVMKQLEHGVDRSLQEQSDQVKISDVRIDGPKGDVGDDIIPFGTPLTASFSMQFDADIDEPVIGITLWRDGVSSPVYATNTLVEKCSTKGTKKGTKFTYFVPLPTNLNTGKFFIEPAVANKEATYYFERIPKAKAVLIGGTDNLYSIVMPQKPPRLKELG
jgi:ABC-type polysaccharide/polyol phosphate transport system ATPase subunit